MGFSRPSLLTEYSLISAQDPAIDREASDLDAYERDYGYDPSHLGFVEGETPTVFRCRPLSHRTMARIYDRMVRAGKGGDVEIAVSEAALMAFRHGVADIENLPGFEARKHVQPGPPPVIRENWLDEAPLPLDIIIEIGSVILARSRLTETQRKNW